MKNKILTIFGYVVLFFVAVFGTKIILTMLEPSQKPEIVKSDNSKMLMDYSESILVFGTEWCPRCKELKQYLQKNKKPFKWLDVENNEDASKQYRSLGASGVPVIVVKGKIIHGFNAKYAEEIFDD